MSEDNVNHETLPFHPRTSTEDPSRSHHPMVRSSPIPNDGAGPLTVGSTRHPWESRESLSYGQEAARGLGNNQKSAGGFSAIAGEEQLINEVRGIYAGLLMVEKKCIEIDKQQSESNANLTDQQWQAMIALHRTLLQEHHDFFMTSQHPTASLVLRRLAVKYAMPARMWRYGIYSFLELLRHRLPDSLDHMLTFIYLAYSMMTLLYETVPAFQETWTECLGDLSRYRMAVEDFDLKEREVWTGVARYWYTTAADKNPDVGRIQHHLALLSRPYILQQLFFYTKSLVTVRSFSGTRESVLLLFNPLPQGPRPSNHPPLITAFVSAHGALFNRDTSSRVITSTSEFLSRLDKFITRVGPTFRMQGVHMASSNIAAMLEYGHPNALLPLEFQQVNIQLSKDLGDIYQAAHKNWTRTQDPQKIMSDFQALNDPESPSRFAFYGSCLAFETLSIFLDQIGDQNVFPAFNVSLSFLWCLARTMNGMKYAEAIVPWSKIVSCLNNMIRPWLEMHYAEQDEFPISNDTKWTPEDFLVRGQIWNQGYYPSGFFENSPTEDEGRNIELPSLSLSRMYRCLWLGVRLANFNRWITYQSGPESRGFSATAFALELETLSKTHKPFTITAEQETGS
ncbi:hypothetical protein FE257_003839 [Aspergillus nanangensis]|uniref:DNA/RNA-binding domain-containing protein n=1 Tax=Aspergillus nanangensis TaxID=2582783 RepID=A0AAD4GN93_ASPNN|nr:hypothetical protein FE257_003839 [Aspergillus nanangensis]